MSLAALAAKYRALARLRARRDAVRLFSTDELELRRAEMQRIAAEFPGALRELDALDAPALLRRADEIDRVIAGAAQPARWIQIVLDWHDAWLARPTNVERVWQSLGAKHGLSADELRAIIFS